MITPYQLFEFFTKACIFSEIKCVVSSNTATCRWANKADSLHIQKRCLSNYSAAYVVTINIFVSRSPKMFELQTFLNKDDMKGP